MRHRPVDQARPRRRTSAITSIRALRRATTCKERCENLHRLRASQQERRLDDEESARGCSAPNEPPAADHALSADLAAVPGGLRQGPRRVPRGPLRGTNAFGACEYVEAAARRRGEDRRCVYATVLRNPIDRVESSWRYFCLNGAERRKGWTNAMKRAGRCSYSLERWAQTQSMLSVLELSTNQAPVARDAPVNQSLRCAPLADGPAAVRRRPQAYLEAALANVVGPNAPVRAVVVEDLADGLRLLAHELDLPLSATHASSVENAGAGARWRRRASRGGGRTRARGQAARDARAWTRAASVRLWGSDEGVAGPPAAGLRRCVGNERNDAAV